MGDIDYFADLRSHANGNHEHKVRLNLVLTVLEAVIKDSCGMNGFASPTQYFAAIMTALDSTDKSHVAELLSLLDTVFPAIPEGVLQAKFSAVASTFQSILKSSDVAAEGGAPLLRPLLKITGLVLTAQPATPGMWAHPPTLQLFHILLNFLDDSRPKVRKSAQVSMVRLLAAHHTTGTAPLAKHIVEMSWNVLQKCTASEATKTQQLLGFLQDALPFLPEESVTTLAPLLTRLLSLGHKTLTIQCIKALRIALMPSPWREKMQPSTSGLSASLVVRLLGALLCAEPLKSDTGVAEEWIGAVAAATTALYRADRLALLSAESERGKDSRLVVVINAMGAMLLADHISVVSSTAKALTSVLVTCLDSSLVQDIKIMGSSPSPGGSPVAAGLACVKVIESWLTYPYHRSWGFIMKTVSSLLDHVGESSATLFGGVLRTLVSLRESSNLPEWTETVSSLAEESNPETRSGCATGLRTAVEDALGTALTVIGPEEFLKFVPLLVNGNERSSIHTDDIGVSDRRLWVLPLMRTYVRSCESHLVNLSFFGDAILTAALACTQRSRAEACGSAESLILSTRASQLWSLFPSFCFNPSDITRTFPAIAKHLGEALKDRSPETVGYACAGLQALVVHASGGMGATSSGVTTGNAEVIILQKFSRNFLPLLCKQVQDRYVSNAGSEVTSTLGSTISAYASLSLKETGTEGSEMRNHVSKLFETLMKKFLMATTVNVTSGGETKASIDDVPESHALVGIAQALVFCLPPASVSLLYRSVKPLIKAGSDGKLQKRCYKLLLTIVTEHPSFVRDANVLGDLTALLCDSLLTCGAGARRLRLRTLAVVISRLDASVSSHKDAIANVLGEVMLSTKDANSRARDAAFEALIAMAQTMKTSGHLVELFHMVAGGFAAATPHMRSAAVLCSAKLVYSFARIWSNQRDSGSSGIVDAGLDSWSKLFVPTPSEADTTDVQSLLPNLISTVTILLREQAREVVRSAIGFCKVAVVASTRESLEPLAPMLIESLLKWSGDSKNRFRVKIRAVFEKLCRKLGVELVLSLVPPEDKPLVAHIRKMKLREGKKKEYDKTHRAEDTGEYDFETFLDSDDEGGMENVTGKRRRSACEDESNWIRERTHDGDVVDLLDEKMVSNVRSSDPLQRAQVEPMGGMMMSEDGRLMIRDDADGIYEGVKRIHSGNVEAKVGVVKRRRGVDGDTIDVGTKEYGNRKAREIMVEKGVHSGKEFQSKKAGGDVKRGKLDPYAYIPLDPKFLSKRSRGAAVSRFEQFGGIGGVKASKRDGKGQHRGNKRRHK